MPSAHPTSRPTQADPSHHTAPAAETGLLLLLEQHLAAHPESVVLEDGRMLFDLREAQLSLRAEGHACTLHLWSDARNLVRRVVSATPRGEILRLSVTRLGQRRPQTLEIAPARAVRSPGSRSTERQRFVVQLERVLARTFPDLHPAGFRSALDLERSFGPAFVRGSLVRGREASAVVAVGPGETQATVDGILSVALLWLEHCREHNAGRLHYGALRVIVPAGTAATTASRMRWLRQAAARFKLYTLDPRAEALTLIDPQDGGNCNTRLIHAPDEHAARERFAGSISAVLDLLPSSCTVTGLVASGTRDLTNRIGRDAGPANHATQHNAPAHPAVSLRQHANGSPAHRTNRYSPAAAPVCEVRLRSSAAVAFLCHGLEFARIRSAFAQGSFRREDEITVGHGSEEVALTPANAPHLRALIAELFARRSPLAADNSDELFRAQPERWLESVLRADLAALDPTLAPAPVYTQVPAFTGAGASLDRGMLDLLAATTAHRLAVIELKANEDLHLAMQGLDYWIRVREHHLRHVDSATGLGDLQQHGYFPATRLAAEPPRLFLVVPALRIHPATEAILRFFSPAVDWTLIALDERWRTRIKPVWTRRSSAPFSLAPNMGADVGSTL